MSNRPKDGAKRARLLIGGYLITVAVTACMVTLVIMALTEPHNCSAMSSTLVALLAATAAVFLTSLAVVGIMGRRIIPDTAGRLALLVTYGVVLLATYAVIALGLLVAFNC